MCADMTHRRTYGMLPHPYNVPIIDHEPAYEFPSHRCPS